MLPPSARAEALAALAPTKADRARLAFHWPFWARPDQRAPGGDWTTWLILAGRGWGKTRTGAEWVRDQVRSGRAGRIALVGRTAADVRDVIVEGESGLLAIHPDGERPLWKPSQRRVEWPSGAIATTYSADEPDQLRGPQHDAAWCDELAAWRYPDTFDQLRFGLRLGAHPRMVVTTTPRPTATVKTLMADPSTVVTRGRTYDNRANLAPAFFDAILKRYEGTRLGRQEIDGEVLEDNPGALWTFASIDAARVQAAPSLRRVVVAVDPAASRSATSDETGIVVAGLGYDGRGYVLADGSGKYSPDGWAQRVATLYREHKADRVVAEKNNGGDMVEAVLRTAFRGMPITLVHAKRGKALRAEPVASLYERGLVSHVGALTALEDQMTTWDPATSDDSPDRVDALVYALTELMVEPVEIPPSAPSPSPAAFDY